MVAGAGAGRHQVGLFAVPLTRRRPLLSSAGCAGALERAGLSIGTLALDRQYPKMGPTDNLSTLGASRSANGPYGQAGYSPRREEIGGGRIEQWWRTDIQT